MHCEWGPWRSGGCSVTCGEGVVHKKRSKRVTEQHGGNSCSGKPDDIQTCQKKECQSTISFPRKIFSKVKLI